MGTDNICSVRSQTCDRTFWHLWLIKKTMILFARSTLRSSALSMKLEHMKSLFYSQNNKMVWLSNMADAFFLEKFTRCAKVCGLFFLDCAFQMLICWADKLPSQTRLTSQMVNELDSRLAHWFLSEFDLWMIYRLRAAGTKHYNLNSIFVLETALL